MSDLSDFEQGILANIEEHGCQVNHIFDPDGDMVGKSYSIGFPETVGQPEVICFGLGNDLMHSMINGLLDQCLEGLKMQDGLRVSGLLEGFDCVLRSVKSDHIVSDHFNSAMWYSRHQGVGEMQKAFQIVWPSSETGLFPWDEGVAHVVVDAQPALYEAAV